MKELSEEDKLFLVPDDLNPKRNDQDEGFDRREVSGLNGISRGAWPGPSRHSTK